jgi:hypothetical protein
MDLPRPRRMFVKARSSLHQSHLTCSHQSFLTAQNISPSLSFYVDPDWKRVTNRVFARDSRGLPGPSDSGLLEAWIDFDEEPRTDPRTKPSARQAISAAWSLSQYPWPHTVPQPWASPIARSVQSRPTSLEASEMTRLRAS